MLALKRRGLLTYHFMRGIPKGCRALGNKIEFTLFLWTYLLYVQRNNGNAQRKSQMTESSQNKAAKTVRRPRAKPPTEINLTGPVGELVAAAFEKQREQIDRLEAKIESHELILLQIAKQTRLPVKLYTVTDFEEIFRLKESAQLNYRKSGKLNYFKPGQEVFYTQQHIDEFIARFDSRNIRIDK